MKLMQAGQSRRIRVKIQCSTTTGARTCMRSRAPMNEKWERRTNKRCGFKGSARNDRQLSARISNLTQRRDHRGCLHVRRLHLQVSTHLIGCKYERTMTVIGWYGQDFLLMSRTHRGDALRPTDPAHSLDEANLRIGDVGIEPGPEACSMGHSTRKQSPSYRDFLSSNARLRTFPRTIPWDVSCA